MDNLAQQEAIPQGLNVFAHSLRPGVLIRLHRAFLRMHNAACELDDGVDVTIGDIFSK